MGYHIDGADGITTPSGAAGGDLGGTYPNPTVTDLTISSEARGDLLRRGASSWTRLAIGASGRLLGSDGTDPVWQTLATAGVLAEATWTTRGDIAVRGAATMGRLAVGAAGAILRSDGTDPGWLSRGSALQQLRVNAGGTDIEWATIASGSTHTSGTLAARPGSPTAGDTYRCTDVDLDLVCLVTGTWRVNGVGALKVTYGPFTVGATILGALGATLGPEGGPGTSGACGFHLVSAGAGARVLFGFMRADATAGWVLKVGDTADTVNIYLAGMTGYGDLGGALSTGPHSIAWAVAGDGSEVRYSIDGAAVATRALGGTYSVADSSCSAGIGSSIAGSPLTSSSIAWAQAWSSVLGDSALRAISAEYATYLPGASGATPVFSWLACAYPDGAARHTPTGSQVTPLAVNYGTESVLPRTNR